MAYKVTQEQIDKTVANLRKRGYEFSEVTRRLVQEIEKKGMDVIDTGISFKGVYLSYDTNAPGYPYGKWYVAKDQSTKHEPVKHS